MGMDSRLEIKVTNPKKGDNAAHPAAAASQPQPSVSLPSHDGHVRLLLEEEGQSHSRRRGHEGRRLMNFMPFKNWALAYSGLCFGKHCPFSNLHVH
ncbi:hypothetical protein F3Y22_tig00110652pilonHSYRG00083 [Hibiscus syriacus]|uniref:Uncharacterized protein n=1 Tax=Hibiscus syriacus TaxID=106335 RepID=A0A6A2ZXC5_HIBSY|nr:hypothetical protein F3Y22_tig00110652pilonHSYRG00083 [Hibiscus syriacus]